MKMVLVAEFDVPKDGVELVMRESMDAIGPGLRDHPLLRGFHVAIRESAVAVLDSMRGGAAVTPVEPDEPTPDPTEPDDD